MRKKIFIKLFFSFLVFLLFSGCTKLYHQVDFKGIDANKHKTFKLGMVKVVGCTQSGLNFTDDIEKKELALEKIPINEICNTLSIYYGLKIDTEIDKTIKTVNESIEEGFKKSIWQNPSKTGITIIHSCNNPYWGNKDYKEAGIIRKMLMRQSKIPLEGNIINITYGSSQPSVATFMINRQLEYEVIVRTNSKVLLKHRGIVASFGSEEEYIWDNIISYADKINDALVKDINKTN